MPDNVIEVVDDIITIDIVEQPALLVDVIEQGPQGIPGPPGPPGSGASTVWLQPAPAGTWIIPHTLGRLPVASVFDVNGERIYPDEHATSTSLTLVFANPMAGTAVLI